MDAGIFHKTNLGQLLHEKTEWFEKQLSSKEGSTTNRFFPTPAQRNVLSLIQEQPFRISDLARRNSVRRQSVHKIVSALMKAGIVKLTPDPTKKTAKLVRVTKKGEETIKKLMERVSQIEDGLAEDIGNDKLQLLLEILGSKWGRKGHSKAEEEKELVSVLLPRTTYEILCKMNRDLGDSIFENLNRAVLSFCKHRRNERADGRGIEKDWNQVRAQLKNVKKMHMDESRKIKQQPLFVNDVQTKADIYLSGNEKSYREILDHSSDVIFRVDLNTCKFDYVSPSSKKDWKMSHEKMLFLDVSAIYSSFIHPEDRERLAKHIKDLTKGSMHNGKEKTDSIIEYRARLGKGGSYRWLAQKTTVIFDSRNKAVAVVGNVRDVSERKKAEEKLLEFVDRLERRVRAYADNLEDKNAALRVLLKQYQDEKAEMEEKILLNMKQLILPVVEKIKHGNSKNMQKHIGTLESNLNRITSSFSRKLTSRSLNLSHQEIQVANYVMHGKTTKEIADLLNLSNRTIDFHRARIRKKMGLMNRNESLRTHLLSLQ